MTTVINTPGNNTDDSGTGVVIGVVVALLVIVLFFVYALPAIRSNNGAAPQTTGIDVNVKLPAGQSPAATTGAGTGY